MSISVEDQRSAMMIGRQKETALGKSFGLDVALRVLMVRSIQIGYRVISPRDENALMPLEMVGFARSVVKVRRQSGAARIAARQLLRLQGFDEVALPRSNSGAPCWPKSIVGSLAHDDEIAIAAIARAADIKGIGIDVEPSEPLPSDLVKLVATPSECQRYDRTILESRILFTIKEAVYKAINPLDRVFLDFQDVEVDLDLKLAYTNTGRRLRIAFAKAPRIISLAYLLSEDHVS